MIIIDGPDGVGKSTLVEYLRNNSKIPIIKPFYPKINQLSYYLHSPSHYSGFFLERYYISELVYPRFKPDRDIMPSWSQYLIEAAMSPYSPIILYLKPDTKTIKSNIETRGDDYIGYQEIDKMIDIYDEIMGRSTIPVFRYDYEKDNLDTLLSTIIKEYENRKEQSLWAKSYLYSGNASNKSGLMFIGEDPSDKSVGEGYIRAFVSNKGCSPFIHECLYETGVYEKEMPYFTNWGKGMDNESTKLKIINDEIKNLNPRKIIVFGKSLRNKIGTGEYIEHPSYIKRFGLKEKKEYIQELSKLIE